MPAEAAHISGRDYDVHRLIHHYTAQIDRIITHLYQRTIANPRIHLYVIGGYGHSERFPASDIDLLRLTPDDLTERDTIETYIQALWQLGLESPNTSTAKANSAPLIPLLDAAYKAETKTDPADKNLDEYQRELVKALHERTDNFYFSADGIVFAYRPYAVSSYADGQVELTLPYAKLHGIIKDAYLPQK